MKQIGLSFRMWATDNNGNFPFNLSTNKGGGAWNFASPELIDLTKIRQRSSRVCPTNWAPSITSGHAKISFLLSVLSASLMPA